MAAWAGLSEKVPQEELALSWISFCPPLLLLPLILPMDPIEASVSEFSEGDADASLLAWNPGSDSTQEAFEDQASRQLLAGFSSRYHFCG